MRIIHIFDNKELAVYIKEKGAHMARFWQIFIGFLIIDFTLEALELISIANKGQTLNKSTEQ